MTYAIFNGQLVKEDEISISPQDRGFRYGDGVFDTMIVHAGKIYQFDWHIERLTRGLQAIRINFNTTNLLPLCTKLLRANNFTDGLLRIQITRGISGRGYLPDSTKTNPTLIIETITAPAMGKTPAKLWQGSYTKLSKNSLPVQFKLCQGLNSTLARMEAEENNCFDALMLNEKGKICETSSANIFWLKNSELYTPALTCGVLEGSVRAAIIRLSPYKIYEIKATIEDLHHAEAVFITNVALKTKAISEIKPLDIKWKSEALSEEMLVLLENDIKQLE
jgi:branched-chain amino acid aminotransferase